MQRYAEKVKILLCTLMIGGLSIGSMGCTSFSSNRLQEGAVGKVPQKGVSEIVLTSSAEPGNAAGADAFTLLTWNIGYAGMGEESDFVLDHGKQLRPESKKIVQKNLVGIQEFLNNNPVDMLLLQEVAKKSWNTYHLDVFEALVAGLPPYTWIYTYDIHTRWIPWPLTIRNGNAAAVRFPIEGAETRSLPQEPGYLFGLLRKEDALQISRFSRNGIPWVVVNIHLSAFDSVEDQVREKQFAAVLDFARSEYALGKHVVIGGDWNLRLASTDFPHNTLEEDLFWIRDVPQELVPEGWKWGLDPQVPTVRTAQQKYVPGENYLLIIDGFLVSPNVEIRKVITHSMDFRYSDHQPVEIEVSSL